MNTIKFYTESHKYMGWIKLKDFCSNWLECKSWLNSGNYLVIGDEVIEAHQLGKLVTCFDN